MTKYVSERDFSVKKNDMVAFRSAGSGYNKEDVNRYIEKMNIDYRETVRKYDDRIEEMLRGAEEGLRAKEELSALRAESERLIADNKTLTEDNERLSSDNEALRSQFELLKAKKKSAIPNEDEMAAQSAQAANAAKAAKYDKIADKVHVIMKKAKLEAAKIVKEAKSSK